MVEVLPPPPTLAIMIRYLIKHNIWKLIRHRTVLGIIIILSLIVSTFGVLFFSGYFSYSYYDSIKGKTSSLSITITPTSSSNTSEGLWILSSVALIQSRFLMGLLIIIIQTVMQFQSLESTAKQKKNNSSLEGISTKEKTVQWFYFRKHVLLYSVLVICLCPKPSP